LIASTIAVLIVTVIVFALARVQGDPRIIYMGETMTQATYEELGRQLGLDRPLIYQYWQFLRRLAVGDLGVSIHEHRPVLDIVVERLPATLTLALAGFAFSLLVGVPLGILSAVRRDTAWDLAGRTFAVLGQSVPSFWVGIMGIFIFSVQLGWLPPFGAGGAQNLVLPAVALGWAAAGGQMRLVRSAMLETLGSQYILLARAKGVRRRGVIFHHALRNALLAPLTFAGLTLGGLITGAIIIETVFAWPGLGLLAINAVNSSDYAVLQGVMIVITAFYIATSLLVDLLYGLLDPRIRYG
jgi:peptide/nickel transport system permease protein